ncbi:RagB/SusD family nutrient uptake outer membrane protein [Sphingobacterium luzhongxinii]|uniref:RagB/SusD family nutrient uptake outer membrane protein n=1 Tax=Sphingobacterium luzhongxinii TaxID=2654181 RepID=UPI0013DD28BF|nr:RagB/SusD family nutrient uptake outer membrane protein [Sphingobacterium sp. xlx-73]
MNRTIIAIAIAAMLAASFTSCKKFLDVSDELAEELDYEKVFSEPDNLRRFHRVVYTGIPNTAEFMRELTGTDLPWPQLTDEIERAQGADFNMVAFNSSHTAYGRWDLYYKLIRQANVFLERAKAIPKQGDADYVSDEELASLQVEARFFRAYYHYLLFEQYGPVPIMDYLVDPNSSSQLDFARNSVDEVVKFVYDELTFCAGALKDPNLTDVNRLGVPTRGTALAVRARLMMYAASPLFNGGYAEALQVRNPDGKQLFPAKDNAKWNAALKAMQEFMDYANTGHYELFKVMKPDGSINPDESLYQMFMSMNKEVIFARTNGNFGNISSRAGLDGWNVPRGVRNGNTTTGYMAITQELVDDFLMRDGLTIEESPLYKETGFSVAGDDPTGRTDVGTYRMWTNREPRFYRTVFYNKRKWHVGNEVVAWHRGGNSDNSSGIDNARTGYLMYKRMSRRVYNLSPNPTSEYRPAIIHRLAEFYLLYAEALNEVNPNDPRILEYVDKVRERAGVPALRTIKAGIVGDQDAQREAIRREMRVELATEGQRYFDVRRWMLAETDGYKQGGAIYGMNVFANEAGFYQRTKVEDRVFTKAMYLYPIPLTQIQNSKLLVQNPLY